MPITGFVSSCLGIALPAAWAGPTFTLTHRWQMDTGSISGGNVNDLAGSLNAVINNTPSSTSSPPGAFVSTALAFNGVADALTLSSSPISMAGPFTIAFWSLLPDITFMPDGAATDPRILNFTDGANSWMVSNIATFPGQLDFENAANTLGLSSTAAVWSNNVWVHIALTFDGSSTVLYYINGSLASAAALQADTGSLANSTIAMRGDGARHLKGSLYQMVTYSSALSSTDITTLYNAK